MTRASIHTEHRADDRLLDEEVLEAPHRLTAAELFTHGSDGWRRHSGDLDDPEDAR